jgi:hypothetical protein
VVEEEPPFEELHLLARFSSALPVPHTRSQMSSKSGGFVKVSPREKDFLSEDIEYGVMADPASRLTLFTLVLGTAVNFRNPVKFPPPRRRYYFRHDRDDALRRNREPWGIGMFETTLRRWLGKCLGGQTLTIKPRPVVLRLEPLEERDCPATFTIANGDVAGLIAAITVANTNNQADTINLAAGGQYVFTVAADPTAGGEALPTIISDNGNSANLIRINGNGATLARSDTASADFRLININGGRVNISFVTLTGGSVTGGTFFGGAARVIDVANASAGQDNLVLTNSLIVGNANDFAGGGLGVTTGGKATVMNSTITGNDVEVHGGGVEVFSATFSAINTTIANNTTGSARPTGAGINTLTNSTVTLTNTIVANNTDGAGAGDDLASVGGDGSFGTVNVRNSLIRNLELTINGVNSGNIFNTDPRLGTLKNNGGPTATLALLAGSPAIDAGNTPFATAANDQRGPGFNRVIGPAVDIGAYEYQPPAVVVTLTASPNPALVGQTVTFTASVQGAAANSNLVTGTLTFFIDNVAVTTVTLVNGVGTFSTSTLAAGSHTVRAVYNGFALGDYGFSPGTSATLTEVINPTSVPVVIPLPPVVVPTRIVYGRRWNR